MSWSRFSGFASARNVFISSERRQAARDVDAHAAQEGGVIADRRGRHADLLELREDELVDEVARRRQGFHRRAERRGGAEDGDLALVADHHRDIAGLIEERHAAGLRSVSAMLLSFGS